MIKDIMNHNAEAISGQKEMEVLRKHFPQCFNAEGEFDMEAFKASLPGGITLTDETSGFNWLGKNYARMLCNMDTTTLIRPDKEHNAKPENQNSQNIYISGDNLDALQHLVKSYSGKVKVIYIDPPYNTGSDGFVYNDKFNFTAAELAKRLDVNPERAERILSMTRRGSASHAAWLTFMLPRLSFARDLLTDDGVIFISIDDNEQANLKKLCDEVFGEENFVADIVWQKRTSPDARLNLGPAHDYIVVYAKDLELGKKSLNKIELSDDRKSEYSNPDNDPRGKWASVDITGQSGHATSSQFYEITSPSGESFLPPTGRCWAIAENTFLDLVKDNRIWFGTKRNSRPRRKLFLSEIEGANTWTWWTNVEVGHNQEAAKEVKQLLGGTDIFTSPKPTRLIKRILDLSTSKDSVILDFFGGSSTTAHAVMQKNAEDGGNRRYILVQIQEKCKPDSEAAKAGYKTIDQVGMERIKRAAKKIKEQNPLFAGDLGFKHYILEEAKEDALLQMEVFDPISNYITPLTVDDFGKDTVLTTWLEADGYGLTSEAEEVKLGNYTAYWKDDHLYLINPDDDFNESSIVALMDKYNGEPFSPHNIVIFGYSFGFTHREELQKNLRTLKEGNKTLTVNIDIRY
nr:site-specific DNA-methyltransferase [Prevotella sp.]